MAQCGGTAKSTGKRCRRSAKPGTTVCVKHGAGAPQVKAKAKQRVAEAKARGVMAKRGLPEPVAISSSEAMIWSVSAKYAEVCWLRDMVSSIPEQDLIWGVTREKTGGGTTNPESGIRNPEHERTYEARANIWWVMLRGAEDQLVKFAKDARACNVDEATIELAKREGVLLKERQDGFLLLLYAALVAAGVTGPAFEVAWRVAVADVLPRYFRGLGGV